VLRFTRRCLPRPGLHRLRSSPDQPAPLGAVGRVNRPTSIGSAPTSTETAPAEVTPETFRTAVESLQRTIVRSDVRVEPIRPPQRLAPYSYALSADVLVDDDGETATGRLVLLHDPDGAEAWDGDLRLVAYASAEISEDMAGDPLLPEVGWSWLISSLEERSAGYTAAGGTVTQTTSTRFGDVHGPASTTSLELRGSWTPTHPELHAHLLAFVDLLDIAAGLPPEGVTALGRPT
jgi:hypothetical protein